MLVENTLFGELDKVSVAIEVLREYEPAARGYYLSFSGGKDSVVLKALADMAGVKYEAVYHMTTVDPPELVRFIRTFDDVRIDRPAKSMFQLIIEKRMPPSRLKRFCCDRLKEKSGGRNRTVLTGIRWEESNSRSGRMMYEKAKKFKTVMFLHPIISWTEKDVWEFIEKYELKYCSLYDEPGISRIGCVGCPLAGGAVMERGFRRWPQFKKAYLNTFKKMIKVRKENEGWWDKDFFDTPEEVMNFWMWGKKHV